VELAKEEEQELQQQFPKKLGTVRKRTCRGGTLRHTYDQANGRENCH
jgi:hypothetical protein